MAFPAGEIAALVAGAFGGAFVLLGFAVLHALTIGNSSRTALLTLTYLLSFILGFPILAVIMIGLGETVLNFRARRHTGPPNST